MSLFDTLQQLEQEYGLAKIVDQLAELSKDHEGNVVDENPTLARHWHLTAHDLMGVSMRLRHFLK